LPHTQGCHAKKEKEGDVFSDKGGKSERAGTRWAAETFAGSSGGTADGPECEIQAEG
jgi:hypothetical protein